MNATVEVPSLDAKLKCEGSTVTVSPRGSRAQRMVFAHTLAAMLHQEMCVFTFACLVSPRGELVVDVQNEAMARRFADVLNDLLPKVS